MVLGFICVWLWWSAGVAAASVVLVPVAIVIALQLLLFSNRLEVDEGRRFKVRSSFRWKPVTGLVVNEVKETDRARRPGKEVKLVFDGGATWTAGYCSSPEKHSCLAETYEVVERIWPEFGR